jgi:LysM repeat protein
MKKLLYTSCLLLIAEFAVAQNRAVLIESYIDNYSNIAIDKMNEYGIPASITLAQGILESGVGQSRLAIEANNHFGIKCHDWTGPTIRHDDDAKQECFRKYEHARQSFDDHSIFLTTRPRYAFLFELDKTDYTNWAKGLKEAGYATDPNYPARLITLIEEFDLNRFDKNAGTKSKNTYLTENKQENIPPKTEPGTASNTTMASTPTSTSSGTKVYQSNKVIGHVSAFSTREEKEKNGVKYVIALENDTYESLAEEYGLKVREIYSINDVPNPSRLTAGEMVYIRQKKNESSGPTFHVVKPDETMRDIAQMYGIKLSTLYKRNNIQEGVRPMIGQRLMLK